MNKKGIISTTILVILTIALTASGMFIFYNAKNEVGLKLEGPFTLLNMNTGKEIIENYAYENWKIAIIEKYDEKIMQEKYIGDCDKINGKKIFCSVNKNVKDSIGSLAIENFYKHFNENFDDLKKSFKKWDIKLLINRNKITFPYSGDSNEYKIKIENVTLSHIKMKSEQVLEKYFKHTFDVEKTFKLDEVGLLSFDKIFEKIEECKTKQDFKTCLEFDSFDVSIDERETGDIKYYDTTLTSKNKFLIDGKFKKIKLNFIVQK